MAQEQKSNVGKEFAIVVGVGPGLGRSLALKCASNNLNVILVSRSGKSATPIKEEINKLYKDIIVECLNVDTSNAKQVQTEYQQILDTTQQAFGNCRLLLYNAGPQMKRQSILETNIDEFNHQLQVGCTGALIWSQCIIPQMLKSGQGTLLFTGATASLRGSSNFQSLACPKFALRALTQSIAREFQKQGIHCAHIIVDGGIWSQKYENKVKIY